MRLEVDTKDNNRAILMCDKQNLPPAIPVDLVAINNNPIIDISWTDKSTDETGFKILRKDSLRGDFVEIATVGTDITNYQDTAPSAGNTSWYRVKSTNANGDSLGSNEVSVTVQ